MRHIKYIVVHCSATRAGLDIGVVEIRKWHMDGNSWRDIGYHYVIRRDGKVEPGRPVEQPGAHVAGHNSNSIGICLVGGIGADGRSENNFVPAQFDSLKELVTSLKKQFKAAIIQGHRDFPRVAKDCPCFDAKKWAQQKGLE